MKKDEQTTIEERRNFLKAMALGSAAAGAAATGFFAHLNENAGLGVATARAQDARVKMAFIQWQPHTVPAAWSKGIEEVLSTQQVVDCPSSGFLGQPAA